MTCPTRTAAAACIIALVLTGCGASASLHPQSTRHPPGVQSASTTSQSAMGSVAPAGWGRPAPARLGEPPLPGGTATMYDSVSVSAIPLHPFAAAGYSGGIWRTYPQLRRTYPQAHVISVAVAPWERAECLDVELGDAEPDEVAGWIEADEHAGYREPCVYSDYWEWTTELVPVLKRAGITLAKILRWVASYVGRPQLIAGYQADQWTDRCLGRDLDCSLVDRSFLSFAQPPLSPTPNRSKRRQIFGELLGAHTKHNPRGHNCQHPPYSHAYPSAAWDHPCAVWAGEMRRH